MTPLPHCVVVNIFDTNISYNLAKVDEVIQPNKTDGSQWYQTHHSWWSSCSHPRIWDWMEIDNPSRGADHDPVTRYNPSGAAEHAPYTRHDYYPDGGNITLYPLKPTRKPFKKLRLHITSILNTFSLSTTPLFVTPLWFLKITGMVLESTIVCYPKKVMQHPGMKWIQDLQVDSVKMICSAKVKENAESSVGLLKLAGRSARILLTSTRGLGRIFTCMNKVSHDGLAHVVAGIQSFTTSTRVPNTCPWTWKYSVWTICTTSCRNLAQSVRVVQWLSSLRFSRTIRRKDGQ